MYFVQDERTRFNLALECGNIDVALKSAQALEEDVAWNRLGSAALRQGNHQVRRNIAAIHFNTFLGFVFFFFFFFFLSL